MEESSTEAKKAQAYRAYCVGEISESEVSEVFGDDVEEFREFDSLMEVVRSTPVNEATDDLFC